MGDKNKCNNLCYHSDETCKYCRENWIISKEFWKAKRMHNDTIVAGYLVKGKDGNVEGILNKYVHFYELAYIDESTLQIE